MTTRIHRAAVACAAVLCLATFGACRKAEPAPEPRPAQETPPPPPVAPLVGSPAETPPPVSTPAIAPAPSNAATEVPTPIPTPAEPPAPTAPAPAVSNAAPARPVAPEQSVLVLGYHQFDSKTPNPYSIRTETFRTQMHWLRDHGWTVVPRADLVRFLKGETNLPPKSVVVTIDDGYRSVFQHAYPVLKELGYPWTFFVYTDFIGSGAGAVTWAQLKELQASGVDIQSHTKSHPLLTRRKPSWTDAEYEAWLTEELAGSKAALERELGTPVSALAYSYGGWNAQVQAVALRAGYESLFTVAANRVTPQTSPATIGRLIITSDNEAQFTNFLAARSLGLVRTLPAAGATVPTAPLRLQAQLGNWQGLDLSALQFEMPGIGALTSVADTNSGTVTALLPRAPGPGTQRVNVTLPDPAGGAPLTAFWTFTVATNTAPAPAANGRPPAR